MHHIIRGHICHILASYCPATLPGRADASYHMRAQMSYFRVILPCYSPWQGRCIISHEGTDVIFKRHIALLLSLAGQMHHIIRGHICHILASYCPATLPGRADASYHMRAHMSYFSVILPCYSPWQGRCIISHEGTDVIF